VTTLELENLRANVDASGVVYVTRRGRHYMRGSGEWGEVSTQTLMAHIMEMYEDVHPTTDVADPTASITVFGHSQDTPSAQLVCSPTSIRFAFYPDG
jgi:hypothetical protein